MLKSWDAYDILNLNDNRFLKNRKYMWKRTPATFQKYKCSRFLACPVEILSSLSESLETIKSVRSQDISRTMAKAGLIRIKRCGKT